MGRLLVVHHTPSPSLQQLLEAALAGAQDEALDGLQVVTRPALVAGPVDVLEADAVLLGTPANIGYMSGALKHFFDTVYYPCLQDTPGLPYAVYVHGNDDTAGASAAVGRIAAGLGWRAVAPAVQVTGAPRREDLEAVGEVAATLGAFALGLVD